MNKNQLTRRSKLKSLMKTGTVVMLALVLILTQTAVVTFADNNGKGNNQSKTEFNKSDKDKDDKYDDHGNHRDIDDATKAELRERLQMMVSFGEGNWLGLPQGLHKKGFLPYGLAKRYSKGDFPFGLAKRIKDFNWDDHDTQVNLDTLKTLIASSETLISQTGKTYLDGAKVKFQAAIDVAKKFVAEYTASKSGLAKNEYTKLKTAMFEYTNSEILEATKVTELSTLLAKLTVYKANYYAKLTDVKKLALDNLMIQIGLYVPAVPTRPLTVGIYNEIIEKAKAFEDHLDRLRALVTETEALLYKDPAAALKEFKNTEGVLAGNYLAGSNVALENALILAKNFIKNFTSESVSTIELNYSALSTAIQTFKNNIILTDEDIATLLLVQNELQAYYDKNFKPETPLTALNNLLVDMKSVTTKAVPLTQVKLNTLLDASKTYIKDLYDQIKAELTVQINLANALLTDATKTYGAAERTALTNAVAAAQLYLNGTTHKYDVLKSHMTTVTEAMSAFSATGVPIL